MCHPAPSHSKMRLCGTPVGLESAGLLASPTLLSTPTPPITISVVAVAAAAATLDPTESQTGSLALSPHNFSRASVCHTTIACPAHTARRLRPRAPVLADICEQRT